MCRKVSREKKQMHLRVLMILKYKFDIRENKECEYLVLGRQRMQCDFIPIVTSGLSKTGDSFLWLQPPRLPLVVGPELCYHWISQVQG